MSYTMQPSTTLFFVLLYPMTSFAAPQPVEAHHPTIYLIRHAEKPLGGRFPSPAGALSDGGMERTRCIRKLFGRRSEYSIGYIMAQKPRSSKSAEIPVLPRSRK